MNAKEIAAVWIVMWFLTWPALFAKTQSIWGDDTKMAGEYYRQDLGFSMGFALLPPAWVITPFVTGFYEHGFKFK